MLYKQETSSAVTHGIVHHAHRTRARPSFAPTTSDRGSTRNMAKRDQPLPAMYRMLGFVGLVEGELHVAMVRQASAVFHSKFLTQHGTRKTTAAAVDNNPPSSVGRFLLLPQSWCCTAVAERDAHEAARCTWIEATTMDCQNVQQ